MVYPESGGHDDPYTVTLLGLCPSNRPVETPPVDRLVGSDRPPDGPRNRGPKGVPEGVQNRLIWGPKYDHFGVQSGPPNTWSGPHIRGLGLLVQYGDIAGLLKGPS